MGLIDYSDAKALDQVDKNVVKTMSEQFEFEQAPDVDDFPAVSGDLVGVDYEGQIRHGAKFWDLMLSNKLEEAKEYIESEQYSSAFHALGMSAYHAVYGVLRKDKDLLRMSIRLSNVAYRLASTRRKKRSKKSYIFSQDANEYTDEQAYAEMLTCTSMVFQSCVNVLLHIKNVPILVRAAVSGKISHSMYIECKRIAEHKNNWQSNYLKQTFLAGLLMAECILNLSVSYAPKILIRMLDIIGVSGDRIHGLHCLNLAAKFKDTAVYPAAAFFMVAYYTVNEGYLALGEPNEEVVVRIHEHFIKLSPPNGLVRIVGDAFIAQQRGNFEGAIKGYTEFVNIQNKYEEFHYIMYWQRMWVHAANSNWVAGAHEAKLLMEKCVWSPTLFHYLYLSFALMANDSGDKVADEERLLEIPKKITTLKKNFGGKIAFHEQVVITKARRFLKEPTSMVMPILDMMYIFNTYNISAKNTEAIPKLIKLIDSRLMSASKETDIGTYCYLIFMKAVCLLRQHATIGAEKYLMEVLSCEKQLKGDWRYLVPQACLEMAMVSRHIGDRSQTKQWMKKAKWYAGYISEGLVSYRCEALKLELKGIKTDQQEQRSMNNNDEY